MNLYRISQTENDGYDTHDSAVVAAENENDARAIHPSPRGSWSKNEFWSSWASSPDNVEVELIGVAREGIERGVIVASFNAG